MWRANEDDASWEEFWEVRGELHEAELLVGDQDLLEPITRRLKASGLEARSEAEDAAELAAGCADPRRARALEVLLGEKRPRDGI